jgi:hypothetical protein
MFEIDEALFISVTVFFSSINPDSSIFLILDPAGFLSNFSAGKIYDFFP